MGMDAEIFAIGKFRKDLVEHLDYPEHFYNDTPEGAVIITRVFYCLNSSLSHELAVAFSINPWKFEEHHFDPRNVDVSVLQEIDAMEGISNKEVADFVALRDAGFEFYYMPNG